MGQPLDFVKVRLQTLGGLRYKGVFDCVLQTLRYEGVRGFYRGMTPPVANSFALNAIAFGGYESGKRMLEGRVTSGAWKTFWAGTYAGFLQTAVLVPFDLVKCQLQMDTAGSARYAGPMDCAASIVRREGLRGLFRGFGITAIRDSPSFGLYFLLYESLEQELPRQHPAFTETVTTLVSGGICGTVTWGLAFPFDTIKTHEQTLSPSTPPAERSALAIARRLVAQHGIGHLYRGLSACLVRAFPVNAATFFVYKETLDGLGRARGQP